MTTPYDIERPEFMWLVDGEPAAGSMDEYLADFAGDQAVRGLWRIDVHTVDGDDVQPVLVFVPAGAQVP